MAKGKGFVRVFKCLVVGNSVAQVYGSVCGLVISETSDSFRGLFDPVGLEKCFGLKRIAVFA